MVVLERRKETAVFLVILSGAWSYRRSCSERIDESINAPGVVCVLNRGLIHRELPCRQTLGLRFVDWRRLVQCRKKLLGAWRRFDGAF